MSSVFSLLKWSTHSSLRVCLGQSVSQIKKNQLDETRAYANPPVPVKMTLECIAMLFGQDTKWDNIKRMLAKPDFIKDVLQFRTEVVLVCVHLRCVCVSVCVRALRVVCLA